LLLIEFVREKPRHLIDDLNNSENTTYRREPIHHGSCVTATKINWIPLQALGYSLKWTSGYNERAAKFFFNLLSFYYLSQ